MSKQKPGIPKGMRDFGPKEMARRNYIFNTIQATFKLFGYQQLETPTMENLSTLTGKYGDEGDQLLFKVLNSGAFLKKVDTETFKAGENKVLPKISEKGLRYDLTVPFARYVVMNQNEITYPFKRFQMQPVWRADRPQKGRYREFYQCDADVVGTDSLICETEILCMIKRVFSDFKLTDYDIKINNRKILTGIAEVIGASGKEADLCVAIDKLDKIGWEKVKVELIERDFSEDAIDKLSPILSQNEHNNAGWLLFLKKYLAESEIGLKGISELEEVFSYLAKMGENQNHVVFDPVLARGLSYYTGAIFEVKVNGVGIGSVSGGGRYDDLTGVFGLNGVSGVGFSFGVDRLYDVLEELDIFPDDEVERTQIMLAYFGEEEKEACLGILATLRKAGIAAEIYPDLVKIKKQFNYAGKKGIPYVGVLGSDELENNTISLKNMISGEQESLSLEDIVEKIKQAYKTA
ncbi:histidine--tRNA ligase [Cyclobacterium sp. 1_MG-2023]|uniref:histidine--tRNA ligase n=1 Tax=Cyclobacterium sp. 1_MG-2023 TaxID=3062681 RepID=UPI0026E2683F|nr:histidine--tRNA ligase [Cyclobacterium sp. 1_MG-2023]MDO6436487.1 histidine--tRNA ligase [Cyclobacterium sp. 1_MG-2023]